jgi:hypothetical protein
MSISRVVVGSLIGLLGLVGLFLAAHADNADGLHAAGLIVFCFAVLYIFLLIKRSYDLADRARHHADS